MRRYLAIAFTTFAICTIILIAIEVEWFGPVGAAASARPYIALGDYYLLAQKDHDTAHEYYTQGINQAPKNKVEFGKALTNLAVICGERGQWGRAKVYLEMALMYADNLDIPKRRLAWLRQYKPYVFTVRSVDRTKQKGV